MLTLLLDGKLFLAPIGPAPQVSPLPDDLLNVVKRHWLIIWLMTRKKVLDVGTGTGIWAMSAYPSPRPVVANEM